MGYMNMIGGLLERYAGGSAPASQEEANDHYDQIHSAVPSSVLASVIGPALSSLGVGEVQQHIFNSANQMSPDQRGNLMQTLMSGLASSGADLPSLLGNLGIRQS